MLKKFITQVLNAIFTPNCNFGIEEEPNALQQLNRILLHALCRLSLRHRTLPKDILYKSATPMPLHIDIIAWQKK
jgi:hypothetical protein